MWSTNYISKTHLVSDIWEFRFAKPAGFDYIPGQYAAFAFTEPLGDARGQSRTMSLTSHPTDDYIAFVTRMPDRASPFKERLSALRPGQKLLVDDTLGDLILPRSATVPLVFVAGGIGIASFVSMLRGIELSGEIRTVHLLYALHNSDEKLFPDLLDRFPFASYQEFVTTPGARLDLTPKNGVRSNIAPTHSRRRILIDDIRQVCNNNDTLYYLSGTEHFVETLRADLLATGLTDTQVVFDYFTGYRT